MGNNADQLFWVVHISDLHLSKHRAPGRLSDLQRLGDHQLPAIKPALVIVTGDLTDAKDKDLVFSLQNEEEWQMYTRIATNISTRLGVRWVDIRGNHDSFDVPEPLHQRDMFSQYSVSRTHSAFTVTHATDFGKYAFVALDATPKPGPHRPFNFFGHMPRHAITDLHSHLAAAMTAGANHTIVFGHYPLVTIVADTTGIPVPNASSSSSSLPGAPLANVLADFSTAYLCGHLHTLNEAVMRMYASYLRGLLELELADWKDHRTYRILAFDHDLLSFADVHVDTWPAVVVTNPKDARFLVPQHEPIDRIPTSTHIRVLAFSDTPILSVTATIDDWPGAIACERVEAGPLHACRWSPAALGVGLHRLTVTVADAKGRKQTVQQTFSIDGTRAPMDSLASLLLRTDLVFLVWAAFWMVWVLSLGLLLLPILPFVHHPSARALSSAGTPEGLSCTTCSLGCLIRSVWYVISSTMHGVAAMPDVHVVLLGYMVYMVVGPWFIGEMMTGEFGFFSLYGVVLRWTLYPQPFGQVDGALHLLLGVLPLAIYTGWLASTPPVQSAKLPSRNAWWITAIGLGVHGGSAALQLAGLVLTILEQRPYGVLANVLSPVRVWFYVGIAPYAVWRAVQHRRPGRVPESGAAKK